MAAVFGGVLLCSLGLQKIFSPAGDAMLRVVDVRQTTITGAIAPSRSERGKFALYHGDFAYILADQATAGTYAGHEVRVTGVLHESTGLLDVEKIELVDRTSASQNSRP